MLPPDPQAQSHGFKTQNIKQLSYQTIQYRVKKCLWEPGKLGRTLTFLQFGKGPNRQTDHRPHARNRKDPKGARTRRLHVRRLLALPCSRVHFAISLFYFPHVRVGDCDHLLQVDFGDFETIRLYLADRPVILYAGKQYHGDVFAQADLPDLVFHLLNQGCWGRIILRGLAISRRAVRKDQSESDCGDLEISKCFHDSTLQFVIWASSDATLRG